MSYRFEQYFAVRRTLGFTPGPDGNQVYFSADISGQFNLWRVPTAGGWPDQLTLFERESVRTTSVSRDGRRIAFVADTDGDEQYQIYLMDAEGGWPERLTAAPKVQHTPAPSAFSPDGRYLLYSANTPEPQNVTVYLKDLESGEDRALLGGDGRFYGMGFSPDGSKVAVLDILGNTDQNIWVVDVATGERTNATPHEGRQAKNFLLDWNKEGTGFYFGTDDGREFLGIAFYDLARGAWEYVVSADWDVESAALSGAHGLLAYSLNAAGNSQVRVLDLASGSELDLPPLPKGVVAGLSFAGRDDRRRLFLQMATYSQAGAIFVLDLDAGELRQITQSMLGNIPQESFVSPELIEVTSFDGLKVPAWLYRPHGMAPGVRVPAVLSIHGGPEAQERTGYSYGGFYQYLLSRGIAILAPNIRGSTGLGISYQKRIHRDWGGAELKDIEVCARFLQSLGWVDPQRLAIWGGSFGGFATLSAATRLPDYWACACDFCGPSNLVSFARSVPPHWEPMVKALVGDPDEDYDLLMERSPITYVDDLHCPLMVVQGAKDPRVVQAESDQMVERLRYMGREVDYLLFEDEGHGFTKRSNQLKGYKGMADYLIRYLVR